MSYPIATDTTTCSEVNLNDIIPSHLMVANKSEDFPAEIGTKIRLRCGNGKSDLDTCIVHSDKNTHAKSNMYLINSTKKCN